MSKYEFEYEIKLDFKPGKNDPIKLYKSMAAAIELFKSTDDLLIKNISSDNEINLSLMNVKEGSLRNFIRVRTEQPEAQLQDDNTDEYEVKERIDKYFSESRKKITQGLLNFKEENQEAQLEKIADQIHEIAEKSLISEEPFYQKPNGKDLLKITTIAEEVSKNIEDDNLIYYIGADSDPVSLPREISVQKNLFEETGTKEIISQRIIVLKVKKPDYLGDSQWEMKHGTHRVLCRFDCSGWIEQFKNKEILIFPGDSLECNVELLEVYTESGDLIKTEYTVKDVIHVIKG